MHDNYNPTPLTQTRALRLGKYGCHTFLKLNMFVLLSLNCEVWSSVSVCFVQANNGFCIGKLMVLHFSFKKQEREIGQVRKMRRELRDGVYPSNPPAQNDESQTQE